ncbi:MAG TPA: plastocyanin/azurin family copper-binding protein, partial [Acidimicrobiales bacterium]|nr:plastocyanin/azurin family copper-binding protein [Acidimicrobiales bacterium]
GRGAGGRGARLRWPGGRWAAVALLVAAAATGAGYGVVAATAGDPAAPAAPALGPGTVTVRLDVEHSLFAPVDLRVVAGTRVRFVVVNGDPIAHELIVGPPELHARHASGSEGEHPSVPGETSVPAGGTAITTQTFAEPGTVEYACHLPGHYEYGMHGEIEVVPA